MMKERAREVPKSSFEHRAQIALGAMAAFFAMNNPARAEKPEEAPTVSVESLGDASLQKHVNGKEAIQERAKACKAAYDTAKEAKQSVDGRSERIWIVIDTALTKGASLETQKDLLKAGLTELQGCFAGSGDHPRLAHFVQAENESSEEVELPGVAVYPIDGAEIEAIAQDVAKEVGTVELALALDIGKDASAKEIMKDVKDAASGKLTASSLLQEADYLTAGLSRTKTADGYAWKLNGAIGVSRDGQTFSLHAGGGAETNLSLVDGGHSGFGIDATLNRSEGVFDPTVGAHFETSLKPDVSLVIGAKANLDNHHIDIGSTAAIRFTKNVFASKT